MSDVMDPALPSPFHLWSPHPFGAYSTTCASGSKNAESSERAGPVEETAPPPESAECPRTGDDRVLLDTWYVIKPGNTKEKVAFFVAYQCAGSGSSPRPGGAKVKGRWSAGGSSRAKRRRHAVDLEAPPSVAEMVARAENRGAEAAPPRPPLVLVTSSEDGDGADSRCRSVAEAVAQYEAEQAEREVRIAFRVAERPGDPITCDLYQLLSPEPHRVCVLLEKMESQQVEDSEEEQGAAAESGFHVDLVLTGAVDRCVFYGGEADETEPLPGQLFFPRLSAAAPPPPPPPPPVPPLCRLYRHVSHDFLEIRFQVQRLLQPRLYLPSLPDHVLLAIFSYLSTQSLAAMKCTCRRFRAVIEDYGVRPCDSRWSQHPLYRDDPCKQCKRIYKRGDVSMCRWHPKPYHHDLPYGRSYWMCCRRADRAAPGCQLGLHDNNWVLPGEGTRVKGRGHGRGDEGR